MIAVLHWCLHAETYPCGKVVSTVIMVCLCFGHYGLLELDQRVMTWRALIGTSCKLAAYNYTSSLVLWATLEYELVDANEIFQGIQEVREEPATRSAVATWTKVTQNVDTNCNNKHIALNWCWQYHNNALFLFLLGMGVEWRWLVGISFVWLLEASVWIVCSTILYCL